MTQPITPFKPIGDAEPKVQIRQFVEHYRPLAKLLPNVSDFQENAWDLRGLHFQAVQGNTKLRVRFTKLVEGNQSQAKEPFAQPFLDFAKAYALHLMGMNVWRSHSSLTTRWTPVLRYVEQGLLIAHPTEAPCITALTEDVCESVNAAIRNSAFKPDVKHQLCQVLNLFVVSLQDLGLCAHRFTWTGMNAPYERDHTRVGPEGDRYRKNMLPTLEAMGAIAYCYFHAEGPREKWVSAINGLLSARPARLGECWFLKEDYCVELEVQGQKRFGLKWWPEKKAKPLIKEFLANDPFVPVIRQAIAWLTEVSAPARAIAEWYEKNPGRIYLPANMEHLRLKANLTIAEAAAIRGMEATGFFQRRSWAGSKGLLPFMDTQTGEKSIRFVDMERAVLSDLPQGFPWFNRGKSLKYSEMLVLIRKSEFHGNNPTSPSMFMVPKASNYYGALDLMLDRHELIEEDGSPVRPRSHQFRHKLETVAYKAGVSRVWMNREAGRARTSQEESYDDRTDAEKVAQTSVVSVRRRVYGDVVAFEPNLPKTYEETLAGIEAAKRTGYVHITDKGCCTHNFVDKACTEFRDCLFCEDHVCIKGIPDWDRNIRAACNAEEANFLHANEDAGKGRYGVREHLESLLLPRVLFSRQVLNLLDNPEVPAFTCLRHAPKEDPYDPVVNGMRLQIELGRKEGRDPVWLVKLEGALEKLKSIPGQRPEVPFIGEGVEA